MIHKPRVPNNQTDTHKTQEQTMSNSNCIALALCTTQTSSHRHHKPLHFVTRFTTCHKQRMPIVHHASYLLRCKLSSSLTSVGRCRLAPADGKLTFGFICMFIKCMIDDRQWIDFLVHFFQTDEIWVLCWFCCINWLNFVIKKPRNFQKTFLICMHLNNKKKMYN